MQTKLQYREVESGSAFNTGVAAATSEQIVANPTYVDSFNSLFVQNLDVVAVQIQLDGITMLGRVFNVQANGGIIYIEPQDDIHFRQIIVLNLDASTAETANKITYRWAKKVLV